MSRSRSGIYHTIEYIGPRPQRPKRKNFFGGWVIIAITLGIGSWFGRPLLPFLKAAQVSASSKHAAMLVPMLQQSPEFGDRLAAAALQHSENSISYDPSYYKISYPDGDVPPNKGVAADVIVRCYRALGVDLQVSVHEDMMADFRSYPGLWGATMPDTNIDHRRVANLQRFLEHKGITLSPSRVASQYRPGDIVVWELGNAEKHIGIVVPGPAKQASEMWVVHNMGAGVKWENALFDYKIASHFRFSGDSTHSASNR